MLEKLRKVEEKGQKKIYTYLGCNGGKIGRKIWAIEKLQNIWRCA